MHVPDYYSDPENCKEAVLIKTRRGLEAAQERGLCLGKVVSQAPICAAWTSTLNKAGMKFEGAWYPSGGALGGPILWLQTSDVKGTQGVLILAVCRGFYCTINSTCINVQ